MFKRLAIRILSLSLGVLSTASTAFAADPRPHDSREGDQAEAPSPRWPWRLVVTTTRAGSDLRAFAIDPDDPRRMFIGTEEGTLLRSFDGGQTFDESSLDPFLYQRNALRDQDLPPDRVDPHIPLTTSLFVWHGLPVDYWPRSWNLKPRVLMNAIPFRPYLFVWPWGLRDVEQLVDNAADDHYLEPNMRVHRLALCKGARYPLLVATRHELLGSDDDGLTFTRLLGTLRGSRDGIHHVACSPSDPNRIVVGTQREIWTSTDGGLNFEPVVAYLGRGARFTVFARAHGTGPYVPWVTSGPWIGSPDSPGEGGLTMPAKASPLNQINWLDFDGTRVWAATDNGIRLAEDPDHKKWLTVSPGLFEGMGWSQITVGHTESGSVRVAVMRDHLLYASDDTGQTWYPWFTGGSLREMRQMTSVKSATGNGDDWWLLTNGGVWTTAPSRAIRADDSLGSARRWARERIAQTVPLNTTMRLGQHRWGLLGTEIDGAMDTLAKRSWLLPRLDLFATVGVNVDLRAGATTISSPVDRAGVGQIQAFSGFATLSWFWPEAEYTQTVNQSQVRKAAQADRARVDHIVQDAWEERLLRLRQIAFEGTDPTETWILRERVDVLDALISHMTLTPKQRQGAHP
jgi:hypothetical protein